MERYGVQDRELETFRNIPSLDGIDAVRTLYRTLPPIRIHQCIHDTNEHFVRTKY